MILRRFRFISVCVALVQPVGGWLAAAWLAMAVAPFATAADQKFETPIAVVELNTSLQEKSPCISDDGLEIYFQSNRIEGAQVQYWVYVARRLDTGMPFGAPERVWVDCANPDISADGLTLYVTRDADPGPDLDVDIYRLTRTSRDAPFTAPTAVAELNTEHKDGSPTITADGLVLLFHSDRPGGSGATDLWAAERDSVADPFRAPYPLTTLNTEHQELTPSVSPDGLRLYFASTRPGGLGGIDIWYAERTSRQLPFDAAVNVAEVNSDGTEKACDISADGLALYLRTKTVEGDDRSDISVAYDVRSGTVHRGVGDPVDVLSVNGATGGRDRIVHVASGAAVEIRLESSPAGPSPARYALYAFPLDVRTAVAAPQPYSLGTFAFPTPLDGGRPRAITIANLFLGGRGDIFGVPKLALPPAPGVILNLPTGPAAPARVLIQAFLEDLGSPAPVPLSITNAIELIIE